MFPSQNSSSGPSDGQPASDQSSQPAAASTVSATAAAVQATAGQSTNAPVQAGSSSQANASSPAPRSRMLLACDRCRSRKSKCDRNLPSCTGCLQAGVPCMSGQRDRFLSSDGKHVPRGYIEDLESQVRNLQATYNQLLLQPVTAPAPTLTPHGSGPAIHSGPSHAAMSHSGAGHRTHGALSGAHPTSQTLAAGNQASSLPPSLNILSTEYTVYQAIKISNSDPMRGDIPNQLFGGLSSTFQGLQPLSLLRGMDRTIIVGAMNIFFEFVHEHYPLLLREDIRRKYELMMDNSYTAGQMTPTEELVVYLVVIVGITVSSDLRDATTFAQTLYVAALKVPGTFTEDDSLASVQVLTLMTIYSLYDPCAGSSWHLLELAVSKCLSMGLHLISSALGNGIETSTRIWAFWTLYSLDRMSGACMGRPFTIANDDLITVPVPGIRDISAGDGTGFLSGSLVTYYQILYRARRDPSHDFMTWHDELDKWRRSSKTTLQLDISFNAANPARDEWMSSMKIYIDLIFNQGLLLVPQYNIEYPTWTPENLALFGSDIMYEASTQVGISLAVHRFPLAWTAGYKAFATGMTYLLCLTQRDRSKVDVPETYHVLMACLNVLEIISVKFSGLVGYAKFLSKSTDMMFRLFNVDSKRSPIADDPNFLHGYYTEAVPRSPNSGVPQPPEIEDLRSRKFRCLARLYVSAMEEISRRIFEERHTARADAIDLTN